MPLVAGLAIPNAALPKTQGRGSESKSCRDLTSQRGVSPDVSEKDADTVDCNRRPEAQIDLDSITKMPGERLPPWEMEPPDYD
ncbi:hypothetical protein ACOMHN_004430 [Nucella lapillus]